MTTLSTLSLPKADLSVRGRRVLRLSPRRAGLVYGRFTLLRAHKGGGTVKRSETRRRPWRKVTLICGALVCTRWGSVLVQFRAWERERF